MRLPRAALTGLIAITTALALCVSSSTAADSGHARTREAMEALVQEHGVPGVLAQAEDGGGVWHGASGVAERGTERPRLPRERFRIGSLTKPFVATVLLQLEAEGVLRLDDPVGRWLPETRSTPYGGRGPGGVTLRQLLGHTSGIPDYTADPAMRRAYFTPRFLANRLRSHTAAGLAAPALRRPPLFAPGTGWSYSNTNYLLAGRVIERATGHPYAREIERRVLRPLKLRATSLPGTSPTIPGPHARGYSTLYARPAPGKRPTVWDVTAVNPSLAGAAGEMLSSTGDLVRFTRALLSGRLLPARQQRELRTTRPMGDGGRYGLGLASRTLSCGVTVWGHEGSVHGSRALVYATPDGTHTAAFHLNADWFHGTRDLVEREFCG